METKAISDDWVIAKQEHQAEPSKLQTYAMVWIGETPPTQLLIRSAEALSKAKNLFPGIRLVVKTEPEFGFVIEARPGWHLTNEKQSEVLLEKIVWELNRLSR